MPDEDEADQKTKEAESTTVVFEHVEGEGPVSTGSPGGSPPTVEQMTSVGVGELPTSEDLDAGEVFHAACQSGHIGGQELWEGRTRKGPTAHDLATADADQHNTKNAGHGALVLTGKGFDG